ncbi:hypothetical protein WN48_09509 [Eufriesea mexicana]|uniref:uncharacterized protein LOC108546261 n=1 Tax=Eufriesea mexicana TaxID=516756 RepID=UPI00083C0E0D|nr:PREDICTED: uncharacterized protein LOC108546261 [Eufriesea mexicana]OAD59243.1 hypothetical protein WN48_09509 [Eufriesea mexicana]
MDNLNEFYKKIQMYLMKKDQECGELKFLVSRITTENSNHIDDICRSVTNIFETHDIPITEKASINDERCVQAYKYLLLNTNFVNQERLAEDIVSGHLVDMCPSLSPYLFIEILCTLEYEKILIESLLYIPFDLCTEIVQIVTKCIDKLPFERSVESIYQLILIIYTKFFQLKEISIQSKDVKQSIENLLLCFKEFLLFLTKPKLHYLIDTSILKKYKRHGVMLKKLICTTRQCLENKNKGILISRNLEKLYNVTFGGEAFIKCENTLIENSVSTLNQQLMNLLLIKVKEIDCNIYLSWAELDDEENNMITLQRSIGIECYYFIDFVSNDEELSKNTHLMECLQQLSCKSDPKQSNFVLSLQELCCTISSGKKEVMKELLYRYKEWDLSILNFIYENRSLLEKEDCLTLLKYLTFVFTQSTEEDSKEFNYTLIIKILSYQNIINLYKIVMMYLMEHNGKSYLECSYTYDAFHEFIMRNANFRTSVNLKIVLLFLLKNPKMILTILLKITIGHPHYGNIMISPNDLLLLSPFMQIREGNNQIFLTSILKAICIENAEWNTKKFINFVNVMLENSVIEVHDLINNVYIPYLNEDTLNVSNINFVLNSIRKLQVKCTKNMNVKDLIIALAKRMSFFRKNTNISKHISNEIFVQIIRILPYLLENKNLFISAKTEIINKIESIIEPIDKLHFGPLWYLTQKGVSIIDIIEDYERRFVILNRLKKDSKTSEKLRNYLSDLSLSREDILRHLIIRSTEEEYQRLGSEFTIIYYFIFGCNDEIDAYNDFLRLTIEACCLCLEYPSIGENDLFPFLFKSFTSFCRTFALLDGIENHDKIYQLLIKNINELDSSIRHSPYAHLFTTYLAHLDNHTKDDPEYLLQDVLNISHHFSNQCLESNEYSEEICKISHSLKVSNFYKNYEVISTCMKIPATEAYTCINKMNELFVS